MKPGVRALGIAESDAGTESTLAGAILRRDGVLDGLAYGTCTVGGLDATDAIGDLVDRLDRPDVQYVMVGAVAPAWYNMVDLGALAERLAEPVLAVTFERSDGLEQAIKEAFDDSERAVRLERYRSLPERAPVSVPGGTVFVRSIDLPAARAEEVVRGFTPEGGRPEPIRVARLAARAATGWADRKSQ